MQEKIITGRKYGMAVLLGYLALLAAAVLAIIYGAVRGHGDVVEVHRLGAAVLGQFGDDRRRCAAVQNEIGAGRRQAALQAAQRLRQPPAAGATMRPDAGAHFIKHEHAQQRAPGAGGGCERGMVREPQIIAKPDDHGTGRGGSHGGCLSF